MCHINLTWQTYLQAPRSNCLIAFPHSPPRRSVMTLPRLPATGRVWRLLSSWRFRTGRLRSPSCPQPPLWSSRPWRNHQGTARRSRTLSTVVTCPSTRSSALRARWGRVPCPESWVVPSRKSLARASRLVVPLRVGHHTTSLKRSPAVTLKCQKSKWWV